jgi:hypothetical protein
MVPGAVMCVRLRGGTLALGLVRAVILDSGLVCALLRVDQLEGEGGDTHCVI